MPPKKPKKASKAIINAEYSDEDSDFENPLQGKSTKTRKRNVSPAVPPPERYEDDCMSDNNDIYDNDNQAYSKIADDVVTKNVKLPVLFDPNVLPGFSTLINNTTKISTASRLLEASFKVYGKRVDVVHTEARKLDQDVISRTVEDEKLKKKPVPVDNDPLNESLTEWGDCGNNDGFFSEEDEATITQKKQKQKEAKSMNVNMTMPNFDFDDGDTSIQSCSGAIASTFDSSFQLNDDNLKQKLAAIAKDRTVLMGKQKRSAKEIEKRLKRANAAATEFYRKELLKRGKVKGKKEKEADPDTTENDYAYFNNPYYQFALNKKREKRHVCIDDVAASTPDFSRIFMHNEWPIEEEEESSPGNIKDNDGPDDGDFMYFADANPINDEIGAEEDEGVDILDKVFEQFQGTLEHVTSSNYKLEDEWVEILGLEKKDLRPSNKTEISFEQTANDDFDPDKRLVDRLVIEGEDEAMKAEEERIEKLVLKLFSDRVYLPGGPGNSNEDTIRRQINSPPAVPMFSDEDCFFPYNESKFVNAESFDSQIAASRSYFIKHTSIKDVDSFGIPTKLFEALQNFSLPITRLPDEILKIFETLPNYNFVNCLFTNRIAKYEYNQECQLLSSSIIPFRMSRYAEQLLNCVIHQVQTCNLKPEFFDTRASRAQSTRPQSSLYPSSTPIKKSRFDEALSTGETYQYFAALEHEKTQRYPNQCINKNDDNDIYKIVSVVLSAELGASAFLQDRINKYFSPQAIFSYFAFIKFYAEYRHKDFSVFEIVEDLSKLEGKDFEDLPFVVENGTAERNDLLDQFCIPSATNEEPAPIEVDHDFDNDFDFHDVSSSPQQNPANSSQNPLTCKESQDIFANENNNDGDYEDADDFGGTFFDDVRDEATTGTLDDSLARIVRASDVTVTPIISTRPKRNAKKIHFVDDDAHWERPNDAARKPKKKKTIVREELQSHHDDNLLFVPRETFANVTTSRRRTPSASASTSLAMEESPRISRCQDSSCPEKLSENKFAFRFELGQTIPGYADPDKIFMSVRFSETMKRSFQSHSILYRGEYSFLSPESAIRQENDCLFWLRTYQLFSDLTEAKKQELKIRKSLETAYANNLDMNYDGISDDDYVDAVNHDFDAPSSPLPNGNIQPRRSTQYAGSLNGEYQHYQGDEDDDEEEIDDFDFETKKEKAIVLHYPEGRFALKRAIKYILTRPQYDRLTLPDEISGIKAPPPIITDELIVAQNLPTSTPTAVRKPGRFVFDEEMSDGEEIIGGDYCQNEIDVEEESDFENDSDETRMKSFKVNGFHTLKSLLFYLPEVCHPDTVRILSVAHVFCTLCHMANENSLSFIQETNELNDDDSTSDCRIINLEDAVILEIENDLDEAMMESDNDLSE